MTNTPDPGRKPTRKLAPNVYLVPMKVMKPAPPSRLDQLSIDEYDQFVDWMRNKNRQPAHLAFTSGILQDCATAFEDAMSGV
jgi:hypothetical protein